jgi:hypothetical protein
MYKKYGPNHFKQQNNIFIYEGKDQIRNQIIFLLFLLFPCIFAIQDAILALKFITLLTLLLNFWLE